MTASIARYVWRTKTEYESFALEEFVLRCNWREKFDLANITDRVYIEDKGGIHYAFNR